MRKRPAEPCHGAVRRVSYFLWGGGFVLFITALTLSASPSLGAPRAKRVGVDPQELPQRVSRPVQYFGDIHPVLAEHCVSCHGPEKQKGGLRLDSRAMALTGGTGYGPAIIPGKADESPLLLFMAHLEPDMQMPPKKDRLTEEALSLVRTWIDQGAEWPLKGGGGASGTSTLGNQEVLFKKAASHWAFQPVPAAESSSLARGSAQIDSMVDCRRKERGLSASPQADAGTLLKRLHFDLTGLPPSALEMDRFIDAFTTRGESALIAKVDELLASPHFGERWARYWLDIARYADAQDLFPNQDLRYPFAWTYRDYVIEAFNRDKPYDQFIREQIAADLLGRSPQDPTLAALGFLTVGPRFLRRQDEQINDRIDVITRGLMGMTVACARCHDHKFDPIPTADFYALHGVFLSSVIPDPLPPITLSHAVNDPQLRSDYEASVAKIRASLDELTGTQRTKALADFLAKPEAYWNALIDMEYAKKPLNTILNTTGLSGVVMGPLIAQFGGFRKSAKGMDDGVLGPFGKVMSAPADQKTMLLREMLETGRIPNSGMEMHPVVCRVLREIRPKDEEALMRALGAVLAVVRGSEAAQEKEVLDRLHRSGGLLDFKNSDVEPAAAISVDARKEYRKLYGDLAEVENTHPGAPVRAMAMRDAAKPVKPVVFIRGDRAKPGDPVDRRFLEVLDPKKTPFSPEQSGRKELADRITDRSNPLTPRVWANHVWRHLMGRPLVKSTGDFGLQAAPPTHPELLDWLAFALMERGWSTKQLVRDIVLSATYRQSGSENPASIRTDPDNTWLWRANRRRLDVESMRDAMLSASGSLEPSVGGKPVSLSTQPFTGRRTVYGFIDRVHTEPMFVTFDFPTPDIASTERSETNVPQQALFALNDSFIIAQARALASGAVRDAGEDGEKNGDLVVQALYRRVYQRLPSSEELAIARRLTEDVLRVPVAAVPGSWQYGFGSADSAVARDRAFQRLPHFDPQSQRYQGGLNFPDQEHGYVSLSARGGHPGNGLSTAAIRRWVAPHPGVFIIRGEISLNPKGSGDGVRARVISSKSGILGEWVVDRLGGSSSATVLEGVRLAPGEILDFCVDCRGNAAGDGFGWAPMIQLAEAESGGFKVHATWDAQADFKAPAPPRLTPLEQMAQALLMTNEFMFVD